MLDENTDPAALTGAQMADALLAAARLEAPARAAAHQLLVDSDLPGLRDFAAVVELADEHDRKADAAVLAAYVDWKALEAAVPGMRLNSAKVRLVTLAIGLATGTPVDMRDIVGIGGDVHKRYVIEAVLTATGAAEEELYVLSDGPGRERNRQEIAELTGA